MSSILNRLAISTFVAVSFAAFAIPAVAAPRISTLSVKPVGRDDVVPVWSRYGGYAYGAGRIKPGSVGLLVLRLDVLHVVGGGELHVPFR